MAEETVVFEALLEKSFPVPTEEDVQKVAFLHRKDGYIYVIIYALFAPWCSHRSYEILGGTRRGCSLTLSLRERVYYTGALPGGQPTPQAKAEPYIFSVCDPKRLINNLEVKIIKEKEGKEITSNVQILAGTTPVTWE